MSYYTGFKRATFEGVPCRMPKWYGELGNDAEAREACKPRGIKQAYYEGGHRMTIDGVPIRVAAHVKAWKPKNRAALCQGFDPWGLTIRPHSKYGFTDRDEPGYWERWYAHPPLERYLSDAECIALINSGEYSKWRPGGGLFDARRDWERDQQRRRDRESLGPNLFQHARLARRLARSKRHDPH